MRYRFRETLGEVFDRSLLLEYKNKILGHGEYGEQTLKGIVFYNFIKGYIQDSLIPEKKLQDVHEDLDDYLKVLNKELDSKIKELRKPIEDIEKIVYDFKNIITEAQKNGIKVED